MRAWYQMSDEEALQAQSVGKEGLTAAQVEERTREHGKNVLQETKKKSAFQVFLEQFKDLLVIILIVAALISMVSGNVESTVVIFAVIIMNAILGTIQHEKAEKSLDSLKSLSSPIAKVMRGGKKMEIDSRDVVPGDILLLEAGDLVVADGRVLESYSLQVNESSLTGESTNVDKKAVQLEEDKVALADQVNMVFSSSLVTLGRGVVVVTGTGMNTEIGKIASLMNATKEKKTPLQVSLDQFSSKLAAVIMVISGIVFLLSLYRQMPILDSLMFAVALAVAAIPEALGSIVTIVQAMGTQKMAAENAIIKDLKAVESLGCVSVICSDKTGTLTQNKMTVQEIYMDEKLVPSDALKMEGTVARYLIYSALLANDAAFTDGKMIGDPTEFALIDMGRKAGVDENIIRGELPRMGEIPFDSDRKLMSTRHMIFGKDTLLTKGAVDVLLPRITRILTSEGVRPVQESDRRKILEQNMAFSTQGLRVLAFAYREMGEKEALTLADEQDYTFIGLTAMMDPPRPESRNAVLNAKKAGIKPVMITGDHKVTASAIARKIGILDEDGLAVEGLELDQMDDGELADKLERISVYARVSPEHKIRIVEAWQNKGRIVAMTGDGVNDAPALKKADIGVAMGITGTEVSKDAAAMILADDNFATIIKAVANGRNVYRNIKNSIKFLLSGNMAGILSVLYTSLMGLPVPFAPVHLLFINLLTDSLPAIAIGMEPAEPGLLEQPPRDPKEGILTKSFLLKLLVQGGLIAVVSMTAFHLGLETDAATASTMAFCTLTLARLFHGFNCRSTHSIFRLGFKTNWYSLGAFGVGLLLLSAVMFIPGLQGLFSVTPLTGYQIGMIYLLAVLPTVLIQLYKVICEQRNRQ